MINLTSLLKCFSSDRKEVREKTKLYLITDRIRKIFELRWCEKCENDELTRWKNVMQFILIYLNWLLGNYLQENVSAYNQHQCSSGFT
jgi:hypothetical protein